MGIPSQAQQWLEFYIQECGWIVMAMLPGTKDSRFDRDDPQGQFESLDRAMAHWRQYPDDGMAVMLDPAGICSFDYDDPPGGRDLLAEFGIDLDDYRQTYPYIHSRGNNCRFFFKKPARAKRKPINLKRISADGQETVFLGFRSGMRSDIVPPSVHPDTEQAYTWVNGGLGSLQIPDMPTVLKNIWCESDRKFMKRLDAINSSRPDELPLVVQALPESKSERQANRPLRQRVRRSLWKVG